MKCPQCNREYVGKNCPYCNDDYMKEDKEVLKVSKNLIFLVIISLVLAILSFIVPLLLVVAIGAVVFIFYFLRKEEKAVKKRFYFINAFTIVLILISFLSFSNPFFDQYFGYFQIEKALDINLPNRKAIEYHYENGFENDNISYTYYKYQLNEKQYQEIVNNQNLLPYQEEWYLSSVSEFELPYIIYDYIKEVFSYPKNKLDYRYIFVQVEANCENYYAYVYKVEKRKY